MRNVRQRDKQIATLWGTENVSYVSHADDSPQNVIARAMRPATSSVLRPVGRSRFSYRVYLHLSLTVPSTVSHPHALSSEHRVPSCSLSLKDRGIPTFLGRHGNAAARKEERPREGGGEKER